MTKLAASNEIIAASFLADCGEDDKRALQSDPKAFLLAKANVDIGNDVNIGFVDNDARTVHLALPYYSGLEDINSRELDDTNLSDASGGELFIIAIIGSIVGTGVLAGAAVGIAAGAKAKEGQNLDGSSK